VWPLSSWICFRCLRRSRETVLGNWTANADVKILNTAGMRQKRVEVVAKTVLDTVFKMAALTRFIQRRLTLSVEFVGLKWKIF